MTMSSRINRWMGAEEIGRGAASFRFSGPTKTDAISRAEAALQTALVALDAARSGLHRSEERRRYAFALEATIGAVGIGGFVAVILGLLPANATIENACFCMAASFPTIVSAWRACSHDRQLLNLAAAVENARSVSTNAAAIRDVSAKIDTLEGPRALYDSLLTGVEQAAAAARGREKRLHGIVGEQARRHVRIKPVKEHVVISRSDGVSFVAQIVDVSLSGAALKGDFLDIEVGDQIVIGSRAARVVRKLAHGIACEFLEQLQQTQLVDNIAL